MTINYHWFTFSPNDKFVRFTQAAEQGFKVSPLVPGGTARVYDELDQPRSTLAQTREWDRSSFNVGISCSPESVLVLELPDEEAGRSYRQTVSAKTPVVVTPHGWHVYFKHPGFPLHNIGLGQPQMLLHGFYDDILGPGSVDAAGGTYEWLIPPEEVEFARFPEDLLALYDTASQGVTTSRLDEHATDPKWGIKSHLHRLCLDLALGRRPSIDEQLRAEIRKVVQSAESEAAGVELFADWLFCAGIYAGLDPAQLNELMEEAEPHYE